MKLQTRLSALLFFLLLALCAGSALITREALRSGLDAQAARLSQTGRQEARGTAQETASLGASALDALLQVRLAEVAARAQALAVAPGPGLALVGRGAEALTRVNETLAHAGEGLLFQRLLDAQGRLALPPPTPDAAPAPFSFLEPSGPATPAPFHALLRKALGGTPVAGIELIAPELRERLTLQAAAQGASPTLVLLAIQPVFDPEHRVVGAIASGMDLGRDETLALWKARLGLEKASGALVSGGTRIGVVGDAWQPGSSLATDAWEALKSGPQRLQDNDAALIRLPLRSSLGELVGAIEVRVPFVVGTAAPAGSSDAQLLEQWFQRALGWTGILGVLILILGILASRSIVAAIVRLSKRAEAVSTGELETSFKDLQRKDEIGDLAQSLERMRISLRKLMQRQQRPVAVEEPQPQQQARAGSG